MKNIIRVFIILSALTSCKGDKSKNAKKIWGSDFDDEIEQKATIKNYTNGTNTSLNELKVSFLDSRIDKIKIKYGKPDSHKILKVGSDNFILRYYIYYDKIQIDGQNRPVVFFTLEDKSGYDIVDKIKIANYGEEVYWNNYNSVRLKRQ